MTRAHLVSRLEALFGLSGRDARLVLETVLDEIGEGLSRGHRIELRDFGVFSRREHQARRSRNPGTGELIMAPAKATVHFKPGAMMRNLIDGDAAARNKLQAMRDEQRRRRDQKAGQLEQFPIIHGHILQRQSSFRTRPV